MNQRCHIGMSSCPQGGGMPRGSKRPRVPDGLVRGDFPEPPSGAPPSVALWPHSLHLLTIRQLKESRPAQLRPQDPAQGRQESLPCWARAQAKPAANVIWSSPCTPTPAHTHTHPCSVPWGPLSPPGCLGTSPAPTHLKQEAGPAGECPLPRPDPWEGGAGSPRPGEAGCPLPRQS